MRKQIEILIIENDKLNHNQIKEAQTLYETPKKIKNNPNNLNKTSKNQHKNQKMFKIIMRRKE